MRALLFVLIPSVSFALNLQPQPGFRIMEGIKIPIIRFADNAGKVRWSPPRDWALQYENGVLTVNPPNAQSSLQLRVIPRASGDREILTKLDALQRYCAQFLDTSTKGLVYRATTEGPYTIGPTPAREYLFESNQAGTNYKHSVSMLDLSDRERLVVVVSAQAKDFDEVRNAAIQSLFTWRTE
jgi:hypothetical protein